MSLLYDDEREREKERERGRENFSLEKSREKNTKKSSPTSAVCLKSEKEFEETKGLVVKEFNHDKPSGKVSWKAEKAGEYFFVDPEKCARGVEVTVEVAEK